MTDKESAAALGRKRWDKRAASEETAHERRISALAMKAELEIGRLQADLIDQRKLCDLVQRLAREERDAILNWPARAALVIGATLGIEAHHLYVLLNESPRDHLTRRGASDNMGL